MTRVVGLLLFGLLLGCGNKGSEPVVDEKATEGFARALEAVAGADPTQSAALLAQGAFETVAPSMMCFKSFGNAATEQARIEALFDCGLACTAEAVQKLKGAEPRTWMAGLAAACPPQHFGIDKTQAALLSPEWFLIHKIGELAAPRAKAAKGGSKARLDQAMAGFKWPLPLPAVATGVYQLAVATPAASVPIATRTYIIALSSGGLRVGAAPHATLGPGGASIATEEGRAQFPGNEVALADLRAIVLDTGGVDTTTDVARPADAAPPPADAAPPPADASPPRGQYKMKKNDVDPQLARKQAIDAARSAGVLSALQKNPGAFASLTDTTGEPAGLHGDVRQNLRGDYGRDGEPVPLLLADGALPAAQVIAIAGELPRVLLAVASPDDPAARALAVELESVKHGAGRSPGQAHIDLAPGTLEAALKAAGGNEETVVIRVEGEVPWKDAVAVAAAVIARGGKRLILTTPELDGPSGQGTGLLGHGASDQGKPTVSLITDGEPIATGDVDKAVIRRVMRSRTGAMRACYERELLAAPALAGRVDLEFTIGTDGKVVKARGSGMKEAKLVDCVVRQVQALEFPPPKGGTVKVRYPLTFKPANGP